MNHRPKTSQINNTSGNLNKEVERLFQIMVEAHELSKECFRKEDFQMFIKANEAFYKACNLIQRSKNGATS